MQQQGWPLAPEWQTLKKYMDDIDFEAAQAAAQSILTPV
jgi:hypothetical protein